MTGISILKSALFLFGIAGVTALVFFLRCRRRRRRREEGRRGQLQIVRVFEPGSDPFNPQERIEFYTHKRD